MPRSRKAEGSTGRGARAAAYLASAVAGLVLASSGAMAAPPTQVNQYSLLTTIPVSASVDTNCLSASTNLQKFDISWTDARDSLYLLADRTNCSLDVFDAANNVLLYRVGGFAGVQASNDISGPDGVLSFQHRYAYVGDGNSTVQVIDLVSRNSIDTIATGTPTDQRADEMAVDPRDGLVMVANDAPTLPTVPYVSFISTVPDSSGKHNVVGKLSFPDACDSATNPTVCGGLEQSVWSPRTGLFYLSVPTVGTLSTGEIAVINPRTRTIVAAFPVSCQPAGLAIGRNLQAIVGCADKAVQVINLKNGHSLAGFPQVGQADEVWFNPSTDQYFVAAGSHTTGNPPTPAPILGIIDAKALTVFQTIPTSVGDHSVAVDPVRNHVFLPDTTCGCIQVYHQLGTDVASR